MRAALSGALLWLALASPASAQGRHVEVTLGHPELDTMRAVIDELLTRHEVETSFAITEGVELREVVRARDDASRLGYVWIEQRGERELTVYVADGRAARILVRSIALETGTVDEVARETVGHIVEATVEALLAGTPIGRPREDVRRELGVAEEEPTEPAVEEAAPVEPDPPSGVVVGLGLAYGVRALAEDVPLHGPELHLELRSRGGEVRIGGRLSAAAQLPTTWSGDLAGVERVGGSGWLEGLIDVRLAEPVYLGVAAGVGLDLASVRPQVSGDPTLQTREPFIVAAVHARASLGLLIDPPDLPIAFRLDAWVQLDPTDVRYVVQTPDGPVTALDPWLAQPGGRLALVWQP